MNRGLTLFLLLLSLAFAFVTAPLMAESVTEVGDYALLPNTANQTIEIYVVGDDQVRGMNVRAQIGDGSGPVFESADFSGGIWDSNLSTILGGPLEDERLLQAGIAFDEVGLTVPSDGLVVRLAISTLGINEGTYPLRLSETAIGEDTDFIVAGGSSFVPIITNGSITIVPEPGSLLLLSLGVASVFMRRRGRNR